ncbi:hypothetical protein MHU86_3687 [Fragilaria crotonensis]|nr:hypothetical protein MHU86_3687 [Fragilaria crotonensis]
MQIPSTQSSINLFASTPFSENSDNTSSITLQLGPYDVLCNRSRKAFNYIGNRRFRILVENNSESYSKTTSKAERSRIVLSIVETIHSAGGRFLSKAENSTWAEVSLTKAKEKVGHALRFAISSKDSEKERTIRDIIACDSSSEEPATKKRKLQNVVVPKLCDETPSADFSLVCALMGMESALPDLFESSCVPVDCERSIETMVDEDAIEVLLNYPIIFDFDPIEDDNDAHIDDDFLNAMESLADPDGVIDSSIFRW